MTNQKTYRTPALLAAVRRIATDEGMIPEAIAGVSFATPPAVYGSVFEFEDGSKVFIERGQPAPEAFKAVTSVWSAASVQIDSCAETSAEVLEIAGRGLRDPGLLEPEEIQSVCASALAQAPKTDA